MATGTRTVRAGNQPLDGFPGHPHPNDSRLPADPASVYVPAQCVGTRRCPLLVNLYHGGEWRPMGDRYGMIILFLGDEGVIHNPTDSGRKFLDAALKQTLRQFAIDPDRIAMSGTCGSGGAAFFWGRNNLRVFSRVAVISPESIWRDVTTPPQNKQSRILLTAGIDEQSGSEGGDPYLNGYLVNSMRFAHELRRDGVPVTSVLGLRDHPGRAMDYDLVGRWLYESWTKPARGRSRLEPVVVADPPPVLTPDGLAKLTAFWQRFVQEPDSILVVARSRHLRPVFVPIGTTRRVTWMSDLPALAAQYPSVTADLRAAGLTAREAEAYRLALISARATRGAGAEAGEVSATSVLGRNVAFFLAHPKELQALAGTEETSRWRTSMWRLP